MSLWLLTADWQAGRTNIDVCQQAHAQEMMLAKLHKVQGMIDLGDLKDSYNPIEARALEFHVDRAKRIIDSGFDYIILKGNHDRIGQYSSRDWFGGFQAMGVTTISHPKTIVKGNTIFACLPYIYDRDKQIEAAHQLWEKVEARTDTWKSGKAHRILLFHCDVRNADYGLGRDSVSTITTADLLCFKYDMCFGGHIHKHQYVSDNAMYVGNPFCFDWGERNQEKGFVLYDDETNKIEFLKSNIPGWYSYKYLLDKGIKKVGANARIQVSVKCKLSEDYYKAVAQKQKEVLKKYPNAKVYTKAIFVDDKKEVVPLIKSGTSDLDKIKSYVAAKASATLHQKQIVNYLEATLKKVSSVTRSREGLSILRCKARNVLSFKKVDFSFENRGIELVVGVNKDWHKHSNGSGKTNFLSLLPIAWEGQTLKGQTHDDWINEDAESGYVDLWLQDIHNHEYRIHRSRKPDKLQFFIDGKDESDDRMAKTQETIHNTLGFTLPTLKASVYIDASLPRAFIEGTQKERTDLISKFQNLERFKLARDIVAKAVRRSEQDIARLQEDEFDARQLVKTTKREIKAAKADILGELKNIRSALTRAKIVCKGMQQRLSKYKKSKAAKLATWETKYNAVDGIESETAKEIYKVTDELHKKKRELEKMQRFKWRTCPTCLQHVSMSRRRKMHRKHQDSVIALKASFEKLHNEQHEYLSVKAKLMKRITVVKDRQEDLDDDKLRAEQHLESIYSVYKTHKEHAEKRSSVLKLLRVKLKKARTLVRHCKLAIKAEGVDKEMLIFCVEAFSREGIPLYLNSLACPLLNKVAEEYSKLFTDREIQVIFRLNEGEFEPVVVNAHGSKKIVGQSSGEMAWAGWITALSLRELAPKTNLLVLDEPGFGLDDESAKTFARTLPLLKDRFETVLVVTHNSWIASLLHSDQTLTIEKEHKVSRLIQ